MGVEEKVTILLVDDDEGHAELVRRNLKRIGIHNSITSVNRGQEALDFIFSRGAFKDRPVEGSLLVLLDIKMPGSLDGIEVLRQIKANPTTRRTPVIMLTTTDDMRDVNRCYELGCSTYIKKPIDPTQFIESVSRLGLFMSVISLPSQEHDRP
jgi:CheY-like chemotaxis protein